MPAPTRRGTAREIALLVDLLRESYDRPAWHGPNLRAALRGVDARTALVRPPGHAHCIWELALHAAFWLHVVARRLTGDPAAFERPGRDWPSAPASLDEATAAAWRADLRLLGTKQARLLELAGTLAPRRLHQPCGPKRQSPAFMLRGAACHNLYHAGQIRLLRRLVAL